MILLPIKIGDRVCWSDAPAEPGTVVEMRRDGQHIALADREDDAVRISLDGGATGIVTFARTLSHAGRL